MANGHIAVIRHDQEGGGLHGKECIHDEHLQEAACKADGLLVEPEDEQDLPESLFLKTASIPTLGYLNFGKPPMVSTTIYIPKPQPHNPSWYSILISSIFYGIDT